MRAREVMARVREYRESEVWLWIATTVDAIEKELGDCPWEKDWEEAVSNRVLAVQEAWQRTIRVRASRPPSPFGPWAVLEDLAGEYGGSRELYQFMSLSVHRSGAADELAYALLCVALEAEIEERRGDGS